MLTGYLIASAMVFGIGMAGIVFNRHHMIMLLMCIELVLLAVNTNLVAFSHALHDTAGEVFVFFILTVAAAEAAIGLALLMLFFRHRGTIKAQALDSLKG